MKKIAMLFGLIAIAGFISVGAVVTPEDDLLLGRYEAGNNKFEKLEIGNRIVYWHQRMIDSAIVEGDFVSLQFDKNTKELLEKKIHWRDDLPEHVDVMVPKDQAESMVSGLKASAELYIISPKSKVFPITPPPKHPCWVVRSKKYRRDTVTIIDAVTGAILGHGIAPPPAGGQIR